MIDYFKIAGLKTIEIGGCKCPYCNPFKTFGNHSKKKKGFSRLRRSRIKLENYKLINK
jgi:hypothetical protein